MLYKIQRLAGRNITNGIVLTVNLRIVLNAVELDLRGKKTAQSHRMGAFHAMVSVIW